MYFRTPYRTRYTYFRTVDTHPATVSLLYLYT